MQTVQTQIRLLLKEQSDQGLITVCLSTKHLKKQLHKNQNLGQKRYRIKCSKFKDVIFLYSGGFLYVDEILKYTQKLHGFTTKDVEWVVKNNDKQRFAIERDENGKLKIRANQGHTIEVHSNKGPQLMNKYIR